MKKINLTCKPILNGIMAYWEQADDAAGYIVTLYIGDRPISVRNNARTELYCSFTGLASINGTTRSITDRICNTVVNYGYSYSSQHSGFDYYIKVSAENRNGEIIAESVKVKSTVNEF